MTAILRFAHTIAARYIWSRRSEAAIRLITIFSIVGVCIGVVTLNVVMAVMSGFQVTLKEKLVGAEAHVTVRSVRGSLSDWERYRDQIAGIAGVRSVAAFTYNQALVRTESYATGVIVKGVEEGSPIAEQLLTYVDGDHEVLNALFHPSPVATGGPNLQDSRTDKASAGARDAQRAAPGDPSRIVSDGSSVEAGASRGETILPSILVGKELARNLSLIPGESVSLLSSQVASTPFGLVPRYRRFSVAGIYASGLVEYEGGIVYAPIGIAQQFFRLENSVSGLEVRLDNLDDAPRIAQDILARLGNAGIYAQPWTESNRAFFEAMKLEKRVYFIVLCLIVVMASFSIISSLIMVVLEKRKDIAILRTLGATSRSIALTFQMQGLIIGGVGVGSGLLLGLMVCLGLQRYGFPIDERIFRMSTLPVHIDPVNFAAVGLVAFLICFGATVYPARRAAALDPCEVLRYE